MQRHGIESLKQYLLLIRLPNVFTAPSNILAGYLLAVPLVEANGFHLASLMISSGLFYVAGIVLNDYFDIEVDKKERPARPLASGRIPMQHALLIAIAAILLANTLVFLVSPVSLVVGLALTSIIMAYNYRLKFGLAGPFAMGCARFLNVVLGASPFLLFTSGIAAIMVAGALLFAYIIAIMILSRKEVGDERPNISASFSIVAGVIFATVAAGLFLQFQIAYLVSVGVFAGVMAITYWQLRSSAGSKSIQKAIKNMVFSIIVIDSIFVAGTAGITIGLVTLLLVVPAIWLARKLYVT